VRESVISFVNSPVHRYSGRRGVPLSSVVVARIPDARSCHRKIQHRNRYTGIFRGELGRDRFALLITGVVDRLVATSSYN